MLRLFLVRATGLEPVRHKHTPLKRACLPVPACSLMQFSAPFPSLETSGLKALFVAHGIL